MVPPKQGAMPNQVQQIIAFCSKRYNPNRETRPGLAKAHQAIINCAKEAQFGASDLGDLLDFLSKPQTDADMARACKEVLEHVGGAPAG